MNPPRPSNHPPEKPELAFGFTQILAAARRGEQEAQGELFRRFYEPVCTMVHRSLERDLRSQRPWMASLFSTGDVVQEVFRSTLRNLQDVASVDEDGFRGYLSRVVRNRLVDAIRFHEAARRDQRRTCLAIDEIEPEGEGPGPSTAVHLAEQLSLFQEALASFPERERMLLREKLERCETFTRLAEMLAFPSPDAARKAFYTAQAQLLLRLRRAGLSKEGEA